MAGKAKASAPVEQAAPASDKKRAIETAMQQIEKMYGKGSIMRLGENLHANVDRRRAQGPYY